MTLTHVRILTGALMLAALGAAVRAEPEQGGGAQQPGLRAIGPDAAARQANPPEVQTAYYAGVMPARAGEDGTDSIDPVSGYQFSAIKLAFSVAPGVFAAIEDLSGRQTLSALGALKHLTAHVTVRPIDANGQVLEPKPSSPPVLTTLEISPSEPSYSDQMSNKAAIAQTAISDAAGAVKPMGGILQGFVAAYHRPPAVTQVAYVTGPNAFGWRWYESPGATIEGLHYATVLLQIGDAVKAVRLNVELVADWRAFGVWAKSFEFTYPVTRPPG
ncbi:MAG TPA: hypothetical protein VFV78_15140 [Vicinamibacterales bacterium]|nr:hypothetical protein [Vicinamibacterales bacterium]